MCVKGLDVGFCFSVWVLVLGFCLGFRVLGFGFWVLGFGFWVLGFGSWVLGLGLRVLVQRFRFRA